MTRNSPKKRSTRNALRHILTGVVPESDLAAYEHHTQKYFEDCQPAGPVEIHLVQTLAQTAWRLRRIRAIETNLLNAAIAEQQESVSADQPPIGSGLAMARAFCDQGKVLDQLSVHHERLSRLFGRYLRLLHKIQAGRRAVEKKQMQNAACDPVQDGFVLSPDKIETRSQRNDRLKQAWSAPHYRA